MDTIGNRDSLNQNESYFDGSTLQLIGYRILSFIVCAVTLGIAYPWMLCLVQGWETRHTVIHGRRLKFNGHGHQLIGKYLLWVLLTVITFGIYGIWFGLGMKKWIVKHTFYADEESSVDSYFSGGAAGYFGIHIISFILTLFTLGIGKAWADKMVLKWEAGHTHIGGSPLEFNGTGGQLFIKYLLFVLLTPLTLGIYALFFAVIYMKWQVKHTEAVYQTPVIQEKAKAHELTIMQDFVTYRLAANDQEVAAIKSGYTGKEDAETLERMAAENNPFASYHLAKQLKGDGRRYEGRALELLQKAADGKYHPALLDLAGQQPPEQAVSTLTKAAQCGNAEASWLLADRYRTAGDLHQAAYWFKAALEWGVPDAKDRADEYNALIKSIAIQLSNEPSATEQGGSNTALFVLGAAGAGLLVFLVLRIYHFGFFSGLRFLFSSEGPQVVTLDNVEINASASGSGYYYVESGSGVSSAPASQYAQTDGASDSAENTETPVSLVDGRSIQGNYCSSMDEKGYAIEYIISESAFFDRESHLLYINFGLINYDNNYAQLKCENGWCTQGIAPGWGITEVSYPYEEPPTGIEVWSANGYFVNSHLLNVTVGSSAEWEDWFERKYGYAYSVAETAESLVEIDAIQGTYYSSEILNCPVEYTINDSAYFDRDRQILYIQFGATQNSCSLILRSENGWCTWISPGLGISKVNYPYEEPPSSIEVWLDGPYFVLINSHPLNVTEVTAGMENQSGQDIPDVSETDISRRIVGEWEWYSTDGIMELEQDTWTFYSDGTYSHSNALCFPADNEANSSIYYGGQYWNIGAAAGSDGNYVVDGDKLIIQGVSYSEDDEFTSIFTFELIDGDILYLYDEWNNFTEYRKAN